MRQGMKTKISLSFLCVIFLALLSINVHALAELEGLEVLFIMDSSGSMGQDGWTDEKAFVTGMIESSLPEDAGIAVVRFATSATKEWYFNYNQTRSAIINDVDNLEWTQGTTATRTALDKAIEVFEDTSDDQSRRVIILITDGNPNPQSSQNPCTLQGDGAADAAQTRSDLAALSIRIFLVGVGNDLNPYILSCLWPDERQYFAVEDIQYIDQTATNLEQNIIDWDGDGVNSPNDNCPDALNSLQENNDGDDYGDACDDDDDNDGVADVNDACSMDAAKISAGTCGCGNADTDTDGDGTANCIDSCSTDSEKTAPGVCGCGTADTDSDGDGTANCIDNCSTDSNKTEPGTCGCGTADTDSDEDGTANCDDNCPDDPEKTEPGINGCGNSDTTEEEEEEEDTNTAICGDETLDSDEECDDGNTDEYDGCTSDCVIEGFVELEADNDEVNFDNIEVGEVIYVQSPMPSEPSSNLNMFFSVASDSECTCSWSLTPDTAGTISEADTCSTSVTLLTAMTSNLAVATDCGDLGSATFNQTLVVAADADADSAASSVGCWLLPHQKKTNQSPIQALLLLLPIIFLGIIRQTHFLKNHLKVNN